MGHRLSKIVTRTGDAGTTGLGDGSRVAKDAPRIEAIGAVDELNSTLGVLLAEPLPDAVARCLIDVQHDLFDLGGELSIPGLHRGHRRPCRAARSRGRGFNADLAPLKEFILPGGTRAAALAHVARTVCRRAERALVRLAAERARRRRRARSYLNRLSDLLFVLARALNRARGQPRRAVAARPRPALTAPPADAPHGRRGFRSQRPRSPALLARIALADQPAFAELYRQTSSHLYGVALRILREPAAAEEVLQEAFVSVWHHAGYLRRREEPAADVAHVASCATAASTSCAGASSTRSR